MMVLATSHLICCYGLGSSNFMFRGNEFLYLGTAGSRTVRSGCGVGPCVPVVVQATRLARVMVTKYGMSKEVGVVAHEYEDDGKSMSTETRLLIEKEVKEMLEAAYQNARRILTEHENELHALAKELLEKETLTGVEIHRMLKDVRTKKEQEATALTPAQATASAAAEATASAAAAAAAAAKAGAALARGGKPAGARSPAGA